MNTTSMGVATAMHLSRGWDGSLEQAENVLGLLTGLVAAIVVVWVWRRIKGRQWRK